MENAKEMRHPKGEPWKGTPPPGLFILCSLGWVFTNLPAAVTDRGFPASTRERIKEISIFGENSTQSSNCHYSWENIAGE